MVHDIVDFIGRHASWAGPIMFGLAFGESFAFLSLLFPGTTIMIAAGAFIPGGTLDFWPLVIGCVTGAIAGDAISFWLGRRYGYLIARVWPFSRRPELLTRGFAFFERHGGKSVFIGRFFGPLRAVIPLVAGIARMPTRRFWLANVFSALWYGLRCFCYPARSPYGPPAVYESKGNGSGFPSLPSLRRLASRYGQRGNMIFSVEIEASIWLALRA